MRYWVKAVLGLGLFVAGLAAFDYGLYELMNIGTCASGGAYVSARQCPAGTFQKALLLPGGFIVGGIGMIVFALRGRRPRAADDAWRASPWLLGWVPLFVGTGAVALVAGLGSDAADAGTAKWTGIFLAAVFVPMGLVPLLWALRGPGSSRRGGGLNPVGGAVLRNIERAAAARPASAGPATPVGTPGPVGAPPAAVGPNPAPGVSGDPVERLRRLGELRDAGVLTPD